MRKVAEVYNPHMRWYQLGELVLNCPKVNYKLNYKPGQLICPRTKRMVYFEDVKQKLIDYSRMPIKFKKEKLDHCQLVDVPAGSKLENEILVDILRDKILKFPFVYEGRTWLLIDHL